MMELHADMEAKIEAANVATKLWRDERDQHTFLKLTPQLKQEMFGTLSANWVA